MLVSGSVLWDRGWVDTIHFLWCVVETGSGQLGVSATTCLSHTHLFFPLCSNLQKWLQAEVIQYKEWLQLVANCHEIVMKWDDENEAGRTLRSLSQTRKGAIVEMGVMQSFRKRRKMKQLSNCTRQDADHSCHAHILCECTGCHTPSVPKENS